MEKEKQRLVVDGNAFYEIDVECMQRKKEEEARRARRQKKGQRK